MALERFAAESLCLLKTKEPGLDSLLMLGRQNLSLRLAEAKRIERLFGISVLDLLEGDPDSIYSEVFLERIGFTQIESMDYSDYEGATLIHDLNEPVPRELAGEYNVIFDGGTLEHLFDYPTAIRSVMEMVKEDGFFVACTPSNSFNGHGFYQFSPELFFRLFSPENGFRVRLLVQAESTGKGRMFSIPDPEKAGMRTGLNSASSTFTTLVAQRINSSVEPLKTNPVQVSYESAWKNQSTSNDSTFAAEPNPLKAWLKKRLPPEWIEWRNIVAIRRRNRRLYRASLSRISTLEEAWLD